ncbi:MAG: sensor domain-containing diguanylate cyclase [Thermodesulfobacteriota bacterium]|nr:sensor domain-containing diguanylate cyclase [Thermodesulfobacteriota bacterium]
MGNWFTKLTGSWQRNSRISTGISTVDTLPFYLESQSGLISADRLHVVRQYRESVESQLKILQIALHATSVVLFWSGPSIDEITVYAFSSRSHDFEPETFSTAAGVIGILKDRNEIVLVPYSPSAPAIPYYSDSRSVGSFFARSLSCGAAEQRKTGNYGILCVDRSARDEWSLLERTLIIATADQMIQNLLLSRDLLFTDVERRTLQLAFDGLRKLNSALDMKSVFRAATQALDLIVATDLFAISLIHNNYHELCYLSGDYSESILNHKFVLDDSLVGQVVKYRRTLPETTSHPGHAVVVNGTKLFDQYKTVLVVPLLQEERPVAGVLIIAVRGENLVTRDCREMIEMIAAQVAIKIDLAQSHEQIQQMAITDPLTGIANRRAFQRGFTAMYERARRRSGSFSLLICDIDLFKRVNDVYGHPFGDQVIQAVAGQLGEVVRTGDLAARIGGEEFAVLLEDTGLSGALDVAERLRKKVEKLNLFFQGDVVPITISVGVAAFPQDTDNQDKLFNYADQALYQAKESGRNRSVCWGRMK